MVIRIIVWCDMGVGHTLQTRFGPSSIVPEIGTALLNFLEHHVALRSFCYMRSTLILKTIGVYFRFQLAIS